MVASVLDQPWPEAWPKGRRRSAYARVTRCFGVRLPLSRRHSDPLLPMTIRIRAHAMERSVLVLTRWAALHVLGLPVFCESMPVEIVSRTNKRAVSPRAVQHVKYRSQVPLADRTDFSAMHFDLPGHVQVVRAEEALVRCLIAVLKGRNAWILPGQERKLRNSGSRRIAISGPFDGGSLRAAYDLSAHEIRAVQLIDAVRRYIGADFAAVAEFARGRVCRRKLMRLWALSVPNADSPPETLLRLLVRDLLPDLRTQVPVYRDDSYATKGVAADAKRVAVDAEGKSARNRRSAITTDSVAAISLNAPLYEEPHGNTGGRRDDHSSWTNRVHGDGNLQTNRGVYEDGAQNGGRFRRHPRQKLLTKIDVASREYWLALFYDGAHHNDPAQREHDALVDRVLQARGAMVLRVTASSMRDPFMVRRQVQQVIARFNN